MEELKYVIENINGMTFESEDIPTFEVKEKASREGVNPKTGEKIEIPACKSPNVKFSKAYKDLFN